MASLVTIDMVLYFDYDGLKNLWNLWLKLRLGLNRRVFVILNTHGSKGFLFCIDFEGLNLDRS